MLYRLKRLFKRYYCVQQFDMSDCGAACLATVAKQYGLRTPITKIREIAGTDRNGTNMLGMIKAANALCFKAKGVRLTKEELMTIDEDLTPPMIAHVEIKKLLHYVVIQELNKREIVVADPAEGMVIYKPEEFFEIWSGALILISPDENFVKSDETISFFTRFFRIILPHKKMMFEIFLSSVLLTIFGLVGTFYFKYLIDEILPNGLLGTLQVVTLGMLTLNVFQMLLNILRGLLFLYLGLKIDVKMIMDYYLHVMNLPISFFDSRKVGEILSRLSDSAKIRNIITGTAISVVMDSILVVVGGILLFAQNQLLFYMSLIPLPFYTAIVYGFQKPFKKINKTIMQQNAELQSYLVESVTGAVTIKAFNGQAEAQLQTEKYYLNMVKTVFKSVQLGNIQGSLHGILGAVTDMLFLWVGAELVIKQTITIGQLLTFSALSGYFLGPIKNLIGLQSVINEAQVAGERLGEILDLEREDAHEEHKVMIGKINGEIEFKGVDFRYGTRELVLKDICLKIKPGEKVALVGESGSGKTTLAKLILKYYLPEKGELLIDGYNIADLNLESLRERIGYVPQEVFLFSGTIRENIAFGTDEASIERIIDAAKQAEAHGFINDLPLRYESLIGERGSTLSGGQRQRLGIARAILKKPDLLILDEATSNLDSIVEKSIQNTVDIISKSATVIIIAHRLSTIANCDRIIVMDKGKVVENGSHKELLESKGQYYKLWHGQFDKTLEAVEKVS